MAAAYASITFSRRRLLLGALSVPLPMPALAGLVYTPHELAEQYARDVTPRLHPPPEDVRLYSAIAELQLCNVGRALLEPQYLLVIDRNPCVQAALLFWRLLPGSYELVGASPASAGPIALDALRPAEALFRQVAAPEHGRASRGHGRLRVYDFAATMERAEPLPAGMDVQLRAAAPGAAGGLGAPCPDGCIKVPASLIAFLDEYGVLDDGRAGRTQRHQLPYRGSHLLLVDSEREDRPAWSPAPGPGQHRIARALRSRAG